MKRLLIAGFVLLAAGEALAYGASRRRQRQFSTPAPQNSGFANTQFYAPVTHNCSSFQNLRTTDVHQVHHDVHRSPSELPHSHITHHVTPVVRSHIHQSPPVEVVRTTKTLYQPPAVVHQTVDYEHHDHVTTHYPGSAKVSTHTDYFPGKVNNVHTQSISEKVPSARKALDVRHDDKLDTTVQQRQPQQHHQQHQHHHHHHDDHAHFGKVPTGNAVVTSYFNFPGSGRSDNKFQAPAPTPSHKIDYLPQRSPSPAYSPLQAQSIEDEEDRDVPASPTPSPRPLYERINSGTSQGPKGPPSFYSGQAPDSDNPSVFPAPSPNRPSDGLFSPSRYPKESFAERKRPEPLQLKENTGLDDIKSSRDSENEEAYNARREPAVGTPSRGSDPGAFLKRIPETDSVGRQDSRASRSAPAAKSQDPQQQALKVNPDFFRENREINANEPQTAPEDVNGAERPLKFSLEQVPSAHQRPYFGP